VVLRDERTIIPLGCYNPKHGVSVSLPSVIGRGGVLHIFEPELSNEEQQALHPSIETLRQAVQRVGS
jgi:L-lactate dehydrogenase